MADVVAAVFDPHAAFFAPAFAPGVLNLPGAGAAFLIVPADDHEDVVGGLVLGDLEVVVAENAALVGGESGGVKDIGDERAVIDEGLLEACDGREPAGRLHQAPGDGAVRRLDLVEQLARLAAVRIGVGDAGAVFEQLLQRPAGIAAAVLADVVDDRLDGEVGHGAAVANGPVVLEDAEGRVGPAIDRVALG